MTPLSNIQIRAIGIFLAYYESDLNYIKRFQDYKKNPTDKKYLKGSLYSFHSFLTEFKVIRNANKEILDGMLDEVMKWCMDESKCQNADELVLELQKNYTHDDRAISMCSKILFLNNPVSVFPLDQRGRKTLELPKEASHKEYIVKAIKYGENNQIIVEESLSAIINYVKQIESSIELNLDIEAIRKNRMVDKLLWASGGIAKQ